MSFRAPSERTRRRERNPEDDRIVNVSVFDFPISAMTRDVGALGDPTPLSFRAPSERTRRQERNPEDDRIVNADARHFLKNAPSCSFASIASPSEVEWAVDGFDFPISAMTRDDGALGDPTPLSFRAPSERTRRQERNPEDDCIVNADAKHFLENALCALRLHRKPERNRMGG